MTKIPDDLNPLFPIFIVSKSRAKTRLTMRVLESMDVHFRVIVEASEFDEYAKYTPKEKLIILPEKYKKDYDTYWDYDKVEGKTGPGPARNFAWDIAIKEGYTHHWVLDDNLDGFYRLHRNQKGKVMFGSIFRAMEDFVLRYDNVVIAGPNYATFCKKTDSMPPFSLNTRIYSCLLIRNDLEFRWRGTYNEDTDICIRALKAGYCTIQFNAFLAGKVTTQRMKGGNNKEFYEKEGTVNKSQMLVDMHPDISEMVWKFGRWHHEVNYKGFTHPLVYRKGFSIPNGNREYGMKLVERPK